MLDNIKLKYKFFGLVALLLMVTLVVSGYSVYTMAKIGGEIEGIAQEDIPVMKIITKITIHQLEQAILFERGLAVGGELASDPGQLKHFKEVEKEFAELGQKVAGEMKQAEKLLEEAAKNAHSEEAKKEFNHLFTLVKKIDAEHEAYEQLVEHTLSAIGKGDLTQLPKVVGEIEGAQNKINKELKTVLEEIESFTEKAILTADEHEKSGLWAMGIITLIATLVGLAGAMVLVCSTANPVIEMTDAMQRLADGDKTIDIPALGRGDEIGSMASAVQVFKENMIKNEELLAAQEEQRLEDEKRAARDAEAERKREEDERKREAADAEDERQREAAEAEAERKRDEEEAAAEVEREHKAVEGKRAEMNKMADDFQASVGQVVETVMSSSAQMQSSAEAMSSTAEETNSQSMAVAAAAEQASVNVQTVASAAEELSASINEITRQVSQSAEVASNAVQEAERTNQQVQGLANAAEKIGEVVSLISDIAEQTNLLALNATIEAARAGDAGKGFAVVANEVKSLASQTAKATSDIEEQIGSIQAATREAVSAIQGIGATISEVNAITTAIASAVEEQSAATQEIARNVEEAATGTQEVTANISGVTKAAGETGQAASQILLASSGMGEQSKKLREEVSKFLDTVRAA